MSGLDLSALSPHELLDLAERTTRIQEMCPSQAIHAALQVFEGRIATLLRGDPTSLVSIVADEDGGFVARGPHGAISQGDTLEDALRNLAEAVSISRPDDKPLTPRPFRVGDRVRVARHTSNAHDVQRHAVNSVARIIMRDDDGHTDDLRRRCWKLSEVGESWVGWHSDDELELVEAAPED